ncbi:hypothetical protein HMN09_00695100 [Mycena chlorophos]|uniref:Uncharacterized protein n=1 Tax=Mycena chlorophos TaxID=658473 RepID=A0A8H6W8A1_MYCCL|nr:hypothetical protein HMN09_00695100 [Mycena chlorophos]
MILDDPKPLPPPPPPFEEPPAYESTISGPSSSARSSSKHAGLPTSPLHLPTNLTSSSSKWYNLAFPSSTTRHVRETVLGLIKDVLKLPAAEHNAVALHILKSCAEACSANGLSISKVLQEPSIEGHTPLYWAVVKRSPQSSSSDDADSLDLLATLLSLSVPLTPATISDVRMACLLVADQALFQRLRNTPEFAPLSATDALLLDAASLPDEILVDERQAEGPGAGSFALDFTIMHFQKRMRISGGVRLEFIARSRLWQLSFGIAKEARPMIAKGAWFLSLGLLEECPMTWVDARLVVPAAVDQREDKEETEGSSFASGKGKQRSLPTLSLRVRSNYQLRSKSPFADVFVALAGNEADGGLGELEHAGSPYIAVDESFSGRLEARLGPPEGGQCIIC